MDYIADLSPEAVETRVNEALKVIQSGNAPQGLVESLASINRALKGEDEFWEKLLGGQQQYGGLKLDDLHKASAEIRKAIVESPVVKRGAQLRVSYIWSKGIQLPETDSDGKKGPKSKLHKALSSVVNKASIFGNTAHEELERCAYSDGLVALLGDERTKEARRVPVSEIDAFVTNPDFVEEVWAYRRAWDHVDAAGVVTPKKAWYYVDNLPDGVAKLATISDVAVDKSKTFIVQNFNTMVGWPLGVPDAIAAIAWAKLYSEFLKHGYVMSRALASFAFKATVGTKKGGDRSALAHASAQGPGQTAVVGGANDLTPLASAGKGYDFASGRSLAAMVATQVEVSLIHLLSDPGAAGSSYGSASNLDLPTKRSIVSRQKTWVDYFVRVLAWMGLENADVSFPSLEDPDFFREIQGLVQGYETGTIHHDEFRPRLLALLDIKALHAAPPEGVMYPNNEASLARRDIDADGEPAAPGAGGSDLSAKQGKKAPLQKGKGPNANDIRSDGVGEGLKLGLLRTDFERQMLELVDRLGRLENAA